MSLKTWSGQYSFLTWTLWTVVTGQLKALQKCDPFGGRSVFYIYFTIFWKTNINKTTEIYSSQQLWQSACIVVCPHCAVWSKNMCFFHIFSIRVFFTQHGWHEDDPKKKKEISKCEEKILCIEIVFHYYLFQCHSNCFIIHCCLLLLSLVTRNAGVLNLFSQWTLLKEQASPITVKKKKMNKGCLVENQTTFVQMLLFFLLHSWYFQCPDFATLSLVDRWNIFCLHGFVSNVALFV